MVAPFAKCYGKNFGWFLSWHWKTLCLRGFISKPRERAWILLKNSTRDFQNSPPFERLACFYVWQPLEILTVFITLFLKLIFWKKGRFFQKTWISFLVQSTKIECAIFSDKTALPEANVKTNRIGITKWTYYKGRSFVSNYFTFLKIFLQSRTSSKELIRCTNYPNARIHTFHKCWSFIWRCFFPVGILTLAP